MPDNHDCSRDVQAVTSNPSAIEPTGKDERTSTCFPDEAWQLDEGDEAEILTLKCSLSWPFYFSCMVLTSFGHIVRLNLIILNFEALNCINYRVRHQQFLVKQDHTLQTVLSNWYDRCLFYFICLIVCFISFNKILNMLVFKCKKINVLK